MSYLQTLMKNGEIAYDEEFWAVYYAMLHAAILGGMIASMDSPHLVLSVTAEEEARQIVEQARTEAGE